MGKCLLNWKASGKQEIIITGTPRLLHFQIECLLQIEGLWQLWVEQIYQPHFFHLIIFCFCVAFGNPYNICTFPQLLYLYGDL